MHGEYLAIVLIIIMTHKSSKKSGIRQLELTEEFSEQCCPLDK